jgi:hypothetical protein
MHTETTPTSLPEIPPQSLCHSCANGLVRVVHLHPEYGKRVPGLEPAQQTFCTYTPDAGEIPPHHVVSECSHYEPKGKRTPARRTPGPALA